MGAYRAAVVTAAGQNIIAQALADVKAVEFTSAKTSSYLYPSGTNITGLTGLQDVEQSVIPFAAQVMNGNVVQVSVRFDNDEITQQYPINTIGLYAKVKDGEEVLFSVIQAIIPDEMPVHSDVSPSAFIYNIQHTVQNAAQITIVVNPAGTATVQDIYGLTYPEFEDYSAEGAEAPDARTAIEEIKSKKSIFGIMSNIKAALKGLVTLGEMKELLVNNGLCNIPGQYFLDAAFGKNLQDQVTDVNNNFSGSGFPNAVLVEDLHEIRKTCVFYYDTGAANSPLTDRGGMGICMYRHDNWIDLMVIPYAQTITYISEKRSTWSSWTQDYINQGNIEHYTDAQSCMDGLFNWVINIPINSLCFKLINAQFVQNASISGELFGGVFQILAYRNGNFANITALSYWDDRPIIFGTIREGKWKSRFIKCPVSPGLGVEQSVLYQSGRGVYSEVGQQNDFTRFVINNRRVAIEHFTNGTRDKTISLWDGS